MFRQAVGYREQTGLQRAFESALHPAGDVRRKRVSHAIYYLTIVYTSKILRGDKMRNKKSATFVTSRLAGGVKTSAGSPAPTPAGLRAHASASDTC